MITLSSEVWKMDRFMRGSRVGRVGRATGTPTPSEKSQNIVFLSKTGPDHLTNYKATMPAFNVGPSSSRGVSRVGRSWPAYSDHPSLTKKPQITLSKLDPLGQNLLDSRMRFILLPLNEYSRGRIVKIRM